MKKIFLGLKVLAVWVLIIVVALEIFLRLYDLSISTSKAERSVCSQIKLLPFTISTKLSPGPRHFNQQSGLPGARLRQERRPVSDLCCRWIHNRLRSVTPFTWPVILDSLILEKHPQVWTNNAGFSGHTSFGHQILLEDILLGLQPN
ncbi:MAG: hypothetical protein IPH04_13905 [Saprospirales bacterium]|nr:hypothetical protein [Saprospirales bacterium]